MFRAKNRPLVSLFILLFFIILVEIVFLAWNKNSYDNLQKKRFLGFFEENIPLGISSLNTEPTYTSYVLTGLLDKYYRDKNQNFVELLIPANNKVYKFVIDLGGDDFKVVNSRLEQERYKIDKNLPAPTGTNTITTGKRKRVTELKKIKELIPLIKNKVDQSIQVEIPLSAKVDDKKCQQSEVCKMRTSQLNKYINYNNQLSPNLDGFKGSTLKIGAPLSIDFTN